VTAQAPNKKAKLKAQRDELITDTRKKQTIADPLSPENLKKLGLRLGLPLLGGWIVALVFGNIWLKGVMGVVTLVLGGIVFWALSTGRKQKAVAEIMMNADTAQGRKDALEKLGSDFKKNDTSATLARAQLQMQDDPRAALATLEQIDLKKVMANTADEARAQRAMIHLMLGETDEARALVDPIDLSRHKEPKSRATLTAIIAEAWARSGQAKRAVDLLDKFDPNDEVYVDIKPQLLRSRAFAFAWANDTKQMKNVLRQLKGLNVQYLMGFVTKKKNPMGVSSRGVHPLLEKEAYDMIMKSGAVQRKMEVRRG
jgi:hypothetical protein